jgi:hypothetical protein
MNRFQNVTVIFMSAFLAGTLPALLPFNGWATPERSEKPLSAAAENPQQAGPAEGTTDEKESLGARTVIIPVPVWVIGSYDKEGQPNAMTSSWVGVCSSKPAMVMTCLRAATYTHGNILGRKAFTVNIPRNPWPTKPPMSAGSPEGTRTSSKRRG